VDESRRFCFVFVVGVSFSLLKERFIGLPTFRKLYAILPNGLDVGVYSVRIENLYSTARFGSGTKSIVVSNTRCSMFLSFCFSLFLTLFFCVSFIGGYNPFLGYAFIAVGALCLLLAIVFFVVNLIKPRALGDPALLSWNRGK
jgi:hypothetical protein